jgi:hypothetical protein
MTASKLRCMSRENGGYFGCHLGMPARLARSGYFTLLRSGTLRLPIKCVPYPKLSSAITPSHPNRNTRAPWDSARAASYDVCRQSATADATVSRPSRSTRADHVCQRAAMADFCLWLPTIGIPLNSGKGYWSHGILVAHTTIIAHFFAAVKQGDWPSQLPTGGWSDQSRP